MRRAHAVLEGVSGGLLVLYPPAAAGLLLLLGLEGRDRSRLTTWTWIWAGYLAPLLTVTLLTGRDPLMPTLQALFGVLIGALALVKRRRAMLLGIVLGLLATVTAGLVERELSRGMWWDASTPMDLAHLVSGVSELSGTSDGWTRNGVRLVGKTWTLNRGDPSATDARPAPSADSRPDLELSFEARGTSEQYGWQWYTNHPATAQVLVSEAGAAYTRITGLEASIVRRVRTSAPLAGRTVRVSVELRVPEPVNWRGCGLGVRTFEPAIAHCEPLSVDERWRQYETTFTFPETAVQSVFEVVIGASETEHLDVRSLHVAESVAGAWQVLGTPEPAGLNMRVPLPGTHVFAEPTLNLRPDHDWERHAITVPGESLAGQAELTALLQLEAGTAVELRNIELAAARDAGLRPVAEPKRRSALLFEQANLAGHSYVASGLLALALVVGLGRLSRARAPGARRLAPTFAAALVTGAAMLAAVATTGSRTAFFAGSLGLLALALLAARASLRRARRWLLPVLGVAALAVAALLAVQPAGDLLGRLAFWTVDPGDANQVSRVEIWKVAVAGIREAPLAGWGADGFPALWREHFPADGRAVPRHAHNFWLQLGVGYGLPGLLAALWLTGGLLVRAVRATGSAPVIMAGTLLAMQLFDHTLTFVGLLVPLVAALNSGPDAVTDPYSRKDG